MPLKCKVSALGETNWHEYVVRFVFGGLITAMTGAIAAKWGPVIGGLFLAFPAIFPASATLVERHERKRKERHGLNGTIRGRQAAALDAAGAVMGSVGLIAFGAIVWRVAPRLPGWMMLSAATVAWAVLSVIMWLIRKRV